MTRKRVEFTIFILLCIVLPVILVLCTLKEEGVKVPHGQRDWSNIGATDVVHGVTDVAELAARLGSPDVFNREGNVLIMETFEHGAAPWLLTLGGTNSSIISSAVAYRTGGYSLKLDSGTGVLHYALASYTFPYPALGKLGAEISFSRDSNVTLLDPELWVYSGSQLFLFGLRYDADNDLIQKRTGNSSWSTILEDVVLYANVRNWNYLKFVCDLNTGYFSRLIINETEYDISDELSWVTTNAGTARMNFRFTVRGSSDTAGIAYLDDLIITRGEP